MTAQTRRDLATYRLLLRAALDMLALKTAQLEQAQRELKELKESQ